MIVYNYKNENNEYSGERIAQKDPMQPGKYLIPKKATTKKPPVINENEVAVFENGDWVVKLDHRGTEYYDAEGNFQVIDQIDMAVPSDGSVEPPEPTPLTSIQKRKFKGAKVRALSNEILDYITGYNDEAELSSEQLNELKSSFSQILIRLQDNRPFSARDMIMSIDPSTSSYVTQEMKDDIESIYQESGLLN